MRMGDEDMADPLAGQARQQRVDMLGQVRAGVDDRHLALADHIGAGAAKRERAGVLRDDAPDPRRHRFEPAVFERELAPVGNLDGHSIGTRHHLFLSSRNFRNTVFGSGFSGRSERLRAAA